METEYKQDVTFSFIAPVYNEQDGLEGFHKRLTAVAERLGENYEIIYINDGSADKSLDVIRHLAEIDPHVRAVDFSRNFGHQLAVTAGYDFACGKCVIALDSDCQHPPEMIPDLVARWRDGYEIVYTVRQDTQGINPIRRGIGRLVYRAIGMASGTDLTDQADFRLMDRRAVEALKAHREHARFVRGLVRWIGFRQIGIPYVAEKRITGRSNYSFKQLAQMAGAGIFNFSVLPLRLTLYMGLFMVLASLLYAATALVLWPLGLSPAPVWHIVALVIGLFGVQFLILGAMGEYIGRIFEEAKGRPLYVVRQTMGFPREEELSDPRKLLQPAVKRSNYAVFT